MLHPKQNRIDYGAQLVPPAEGYELTYAVGTSYSLDLDALMLLPVALFYAQNLDGDAGNLRYDMLDALTRSSEKIALFYQTGQLKVPKNYHPLIAYWEKAIHAVSMPDHLSSFHPKTWVIRYDHPQEAAIYRLLVTSRNMTFDRSWDIAFSTTGFVTDQERAENEPIIDFMEGLTSNSTAQLPPSFLEDLHCVKFDQPDGFNKVRFFPIGTHVPGGGQNPNPVFQKNWDELLIVSPFLDQTTLRLAAARCGGKAWLLSSKEALDGMDADTLKPFECWQFSTTIEQAEHMHNMEEQGLEPQDQNLHAKLYIGKRLDKVSWYLGSANCTSPAQSRNIETLIRLNSNGSPLLAPKSIIRQLTESEKHIVIDEGGNKKTEKGLPIFEPYIPSLSPQAEVEQQWAQMVRRIRFDLSNIELRGVARQPAGSVHYSLEISIEASSLELPDGVEVKYLPLAEARRNPTTLIPGCVNVCEHYDGYPETQLTPYIIWIIEYKGLSHRFLLPMRIELPATRLGKIFTSIIDSKEKFMNYILFLLNGKETSLVDEAKGDRVASGKGAESWLFDGAPVFENLMIAASRQPEKLEAIDQLIKRMQQESEEKAQKIITPEFESLWEVFKSYKTN